MSYALNMTPEEFEDALQKAQTAVQPEVLATAVQQLNTQLAELSGNISSLQIALAALPTVTVSAEQPSGGKDGDVWVVV